MIQEEKDILIRDLSARQPFGVKVVCTSDSDHNWYNLELIDIKDDEVYITTSEPHYSNKYASIESIKPYLFPLSSMTEEQKEEYCRLQDKVIYNSKGVITEDVMEYVNWCYKNHIDINELIPKNLGIDATGLNIY